jgi:hypothetical protein
MPNILVPIDVPLADGPGAATDTSRTGASKTFIFSGSVRGRYVIEGSNDGTNWDVLVGRDGNGIAFASSVPGPKTVDALVKQVRVFSEGNGRVATAPSITMGAPPALGNNVFAGLDVPAATGAGAVFDLGPEVGPLKTFIARGPFPPRSRYAVQGSIDGTHFDDLALFDADQDGAKSVSVMCRFLRVQRFAFSGVAPAIAVGAEGLFDPGVASLELTLSDDGERQTTTATDEEVLFQFPVPLKSLGSPIIGLSLAALSIQGTTPGTATFRVRLGGAPLAPDGTEILNLTDAAPFEKSVFGSAAPFPAPSDDVALVKVTGQGDGTLRPAMRGVALLFRRST